MKTIGNGVIFFEVDDSYSFDGLLPLRINIKGHYLGTLESPTYLTSFMGEMESIVQDNCYLNENARIDNIESILFNEYGELVDIYRITIEETFDDFSKRVVRNNESIFFYFKLFSNAFFEYSEVKENEDILECISKKDYVDALALLKEYTASLNI